MMADMYDCRIEKLNYLEEATSMGAAVIGGVAAGVFPDFDVIRRFIRVEEVVEPNPANQAVYRKMMPIFEKCYQALVDVYQDLSAL
jgi:xylulokinase